MTSSSPCFRAAARLTQSQTLNLASTPTLILKPNLKMFGQQDECLKPCISSLFTLPTFFFPPSPQNKTLLLLLHAPAASLLKELSLICWGLTRRSPDTGQGFDVPPPLPHLNIWEMIMKVFSFWEGLVRRQETGNCGSSAVTHRVRRQQRALLLHVVTEATEKIKNPPLAV